MIKRPNTKAQRVRRHQRVRGKISGTAERPRLSVFRSENNIYAQIIDDVAGKTLCSASTVEKGFEGNGGNCEAAAKIGKLIGERAVAVGEYRTHRDVVQRCERFVVAGKRRRGGKVGVRRLRCERDAFEIARHLGIAKSVIGKKRCKAFLAVPFQDIDILVRHRLIDVGENVALIHMLSVGGQKLGIAHRNLAAAPSAHGDGDMSADIFPEIENTLCNLAPRDGADRRSGAKRRRDPRRCAHCPTRCRQNPHRTSRRSPTARRAFRRSGAG